MHPYRSHKTLSFSKFPICLNGYLKKSKLKEQTAIAKNKFTSDLTTN